MKVSAIIRLCGGANAVAEKLGMTRQAVRRWARVDRIPNNKVHLMIIHFEHIVSKKVFEE